jgi:RNA polymerase sigma-70 factor (ECF subfamily)
LKTIGLLEEKELVRLCQQENPRGHEAVYQLYADRLFRLSLRYIRDQADAEDVLMTAFVKAFRHIKTFSYRDAGSLEGWLRKIVVNEALMWLRRKHNFNLTENIDDQVHEPDLAAFSSLEADDILQFIAQLPTGYRTVFNLSVIEGYDHAEIASLLSINEATSRSQLFKAKSLLRKMLMREGYNYGT